MLLLVRTFSYTPEASFSGGFLLHSSRWFYWGVSLVSDTPSAGFSEELLLHFWSLFITRSFPYTPDSSKEFLIHFSCWFSLVRSFFYTPHALFIREDFSLTLLMLVRNSHTFLLLVQLSEEFLLHTSCFVYSWGVSLTLLMLLLVRSYSYTPHAMFIREDHRVSLTHLMIVLVRCFSCTPDDTSSEMFLLHTSCQF